MHYAIQNEVCSVQPKSICDSDAQMNSPANSAGFLQFCDDLHCLLSFLCVYFLRVCPLHKCRAVCSLYPPSLPLIVQFPPTCCISAWPTLKADFRSDWVHSKEWQPTLAALLCRQCVHLVIGGNRASFVSSPVSTQKHDTFQSNYTMSSVYSPGPACTFGAIGLVPVLSGISAGSRCHCRTNGVISTAIRLIPLRLKKMIILMPDSLLLDGLQPDVVSVDHVTSH